jgi:glutamate dehydrogenase (NAD(P)+)
MGYTVVGIADAKQMLVCEDGIDPEPLARGKNIYGEMDPATFPSNAKVLPNTQWLDVECDILIPAALEDVINEGNAHKVKASLLVEAANIPVSSGGDKIINERKIDVSPDFVTNLGAIRFFDRTQFNLIEFTTEAAINDIEDIIRRNIKKVFEDAKKTGKTQREVAMKLFTPTIQDEPEMYPAY